MENSEEKTYSENPFKLTLDILGILNKKMKQVSKRKYIFFYEKKVKMIYQMKIFNIKKYSVLM